MLRIIFAAILLLPFFLNSQNITVVEETAKELIVKIEIVDFQLNYGAEFAEITLENGLQNSEAGSPDIPFLNLNLAVPPNGNLRYSIVSQKKEKLKLQKPILPVAKIVKNSSTHDFIYHVDVEKYRQINDLIVKNGKSQYRSFSLIPLKISPFQYNHQNLELEVITELTLKIDIIGQTNYHQMIDEDFEFLYPKFILNYKTAKFWKNIPQRFFVKMPFAKSEFWYKMLASKSSDNYMDFAELSQLPQFCDPASVRLFTMRKVEGKYEVIELPIFIENGNKMEFEQNTKIYFTAENNENYWLTFGSEFLGKPKRIFQKNELSQKVISFQKKEIKPKNTKTDLELIIIYPKANVFQNQTAELAEIHSDLIAELKSQAEIFDEYSGGVADKDAIRDYLAETYQNNSNLQYVILMGAGSDEWDDYSPKNKIMVYKRSSTVSDDYFVDFAQLGRPDLVIGRLPAKNDAELDVIIDKISRYKKTPTFGFWRNKFLIMADDENHEDHFEGFGTAQMNHSRYAQELDDLINDDIFVDKIFAFNYEFDAYQTKPEAREAMVDVVNEGCLAWLFIGHGNEDVIGDEDYFSGALHMNMLKNYDKPSLFFAASCSGGKYQMKNFVCLAEKLVLHDNGGSIISIAGTDATFPGPNAKLYKHYFQYIFEDRMSAGIALVAAKLFLTNTLDAAHFNILGDPILDIIPPESVGEIVGITDSIRARETVGITGNFNENIFNSAQIMVFEPKHEIVYENFDFLNHDESEHYTVNYTQNGNKLYNANVSLNAGEYSAEFIVPDDIYAGEDGRILTYVNGEDVDFINTLTSINTSDDTIDGIENDGAPQVQIWLDSKTFQTGDYVSTNPLLMVEISDENGINILGSAGRKMLVQIDENQELIDVTDGFIYDENSCTKGELTWQLNGISEGEHSLLLVVFDNFNLPTVIEVLFTAKQFGKVAIEQLLPYPNPMCDETNFTFIMTETADVTVTIYTISGRKIRTIEAGNLSSGFQQIYWNGEDKTGDDIANGTYFYKIIANQNGKISEKIGKIIILK
ncbi:MAG: T9SS type A sorting domain-containing protein [Candidatus Cloacimonetes bacterium]|jgi:hypothetical protein|nr:T9SS type A sorting domain-containing protein [Candidatus Cloacimonadota bacterium]MBT6994280.1 T9SS type A sorting domain-containing protein [Candidatus Cloacimonadota bacterium]MBT7469128.1 T9SS type A sorting domain-containing protein [Candidatus Cloacimonadota bacterium]